MGEFSIVSELSLQSYPHSGIWANSAQHVHKSVSAALLVASAVRTITVILTIVGEIANNQELFGCHSSPCLTGSHLKKSMLHEWQSPLFHLPPYLWHTHKHTHKPHNSAPQQLSPSATSVPCPLRKDDMCLMAKITARSTFSVSSAAGTPRPGASSRTGGRLTEWHVCTAQRLRKKKM